MMRLLLVGMLVLIAGVSAAQTKKVMPLLAQNLAGIAGKEGAMLTVETRPERPTPSTAMTRTFSFTCLKAPSSCR